MNSFEGIVGSAEDHREAYEDFARKVVVDEAERQGLSPDPSEWTDEERKQLQEHFDSQGPIPTRVSIEVQPHNQWVKVYSVGST
jgi:hypothetical protein